MVLMVNNLTGFGGGGLQPDIYFSGTNQTQVIPGGAKQVVIELYGSGGFGGDGVLFGNAGGGGGGAGYCKKTITLASTDAGKTFTFTVGTGGIGSKVDNGTFGTVTTLRANAGGAGGNGVGGTAGTATGGDVNTSGTAGNAFITGGTAGGPAGGVSDTVPGGGGSGGLLGAGVAGAGGEVIFTWS